jgi:hypothetical protein
VKKWIFGNATKISFLDKLLSGVSKLLVGTVYSFLIEKYG